MTLSTSSAQAETRRALIVDDEPHIRRLLHELLSKMELDAHVAADGVEAIAQLETESFDLMLLDMMIPEPDGMAVLRWAREHRPFVRVIVITAYGTPLNAVESVQIGAADFIAKPFYVEEVRRHVARVLSQPADDLEPADYEAASDAAPGRINDRQFDAAAAYVYEALRQDDRRPEVYNLLGNLYRLRGSPVEARRCFERALSLDFTHAQALRNLRELPRQRSGDEKGRDASSPQGAFDRNED